MHHGVCEQCAVCCGMCVCVCAGGESKTRYDVRTKPFILVRSSSFVRHTHLSVYCLYATCYGVTTFSSSMLLRRICKVDHTRAPVDDLLLTASALPVALHQVSISLQAQHQLTSSASTIHTHGKVLPKLRSQGKERKATARTKARLHTCEAVCVC